MKHFYAVVTLLIVTGFIAHGENLKADSPLHKYAAGSHVFLDVNDSNRLLVLGVQNSYLFDLKKLRKINDVGSFDSSCVSDNAIYVHPYLVSIEKTCVFNDDKLIVLKTAESKPRDSHFSLAYIGKKEKKLYFLFNGREFPDAKAGYIQVKTVDTRNHQSEVYDWLEGVPGFSGALSADAESFYLTVAHPNQTNSLYAIDKKQVYNSIFLKKEKTFEVVFKEPITSFGGLSWKLYVSSSQFVYDNRSSLADAKSVVIDRNLQNLRSIKLPEGCNVLGFCDQGLLLRHDGKGVFCYDE